MKILISAFSGAPDMGSEDGRAWNLETRLADFHEIWVITQSHHQVTIKKFMSTHPDINIIFVFYDIPLLGSFTRWLSTSFILRPYIMNFYYYLWQVAIYPVIFRLHKHQHFDLTHHISYTRYWMPSLLALLPVPFIWGTVGGAEIIPYKLLSTFSGLGYFFESVRRIMLRLAEFDPLVRLTARRSVAALAMTPATIARLQVLCTPNIVQAIDSGLGIENELSELGKSPEPAVPPLRFLSVGRLISWKGYHLSLQAFAQLTDLQTEYWFFGSGSEHARLEELCRKLNIYDRVHFFGFAPREQVLQAYAKSHIFVHPSLHETGGVSVLEAMAARRPVICLDLGGPAVIVTEQVGIKISVDTPRQVINDLACAMRCLAQNSKLREKMGHAGRQRIEKYFTWDSHVKQILNIYEDAVLTKNA